MSAGTLSAAASRCKIAAEGGPPCTWVEPMRLAASTTPGHDLLEPRDAP
jgi:hypothetical protein